MSTLCVCWCTQFQYYTDKYYLSLQAHLEQVNGITSRPKGGVFVKIIPRTQ